jgi:hypothetical protein
MEYSVGQILYFVGAESARVIPVRVVEEVVRTTIDGKEKSYTVELPDEKKTRIGMTKMKGEPFSSVVDVHEHMLRNAKEAIENMVNEAVALTKEAFDVTEATKELTNDEKLETVTKDGDLESVQSESGDDNIVSVDIGNGVMAKMNISDLEKVDT